MPEEPTTPDLVELVRGLASDPQDLDLALRFLADDAVWETKGLGLRVEGLPAIRKFLEEWLAPYEEFAIEMQDVADFGNGVVLATARQKGRLPETARSARVHGDYAHVFVWSDGAIRRVLGYGDIDEARAAAERLAEERG